MSVDPPNQSIADLVVKGELDSLKKAKEKLEEENKTLAETIVAKEKAEEAEKEKLDDLSNKLKGYEEQDAKALRKFIMENSNYKEDDLKELSVEGLQGIKEILGKAKSDVSVQRTGLLLKPDEREGPTGKLERWNPDKNEWETR